jgi:hypothetical protein
MKCCSCLHSFVLFTACKQASGFSSKDVAWTGSPFSHFFAREGGPKQMAQRRGVSKLFRETSSVVVWWCAVGEFKRSAQFGYRVSFALRPSFRLPDTRQMLSVLSSRRRRACGLPSALSVVSGQVPGKGAGGWGNQNTVRPVGSFATD